MSRYKTSRIGWSSHILSKQTAMFFLSTDVPRIHIATISWRCRCFQAWAVQSKCFWLQNPSLRLQTLDFSVGVTVLKFNTVKNWHYSLISQTLGLKISMSLNRTFFILQPCSINTLPFPPKCRPLPLKWKLRGGGWRIFPPPPRNFMNGYQKWWFLKCISF